MTILSFMLLAATTIESSVIQMTGAGMHYSELENQLTYAYRSLEKDLGNTELVQILEAPNPLNTSNPGPHLYRWKVRPKGGNPNGAEDVTYVIDLRPENPSLFQRTFQITVKDLVAQGKLILGPLKYPQGSQNQFAVWFTNNNKLMRLNLGLKSANYVKKEVNVPGYSRSIWIRMGKVQDCRSGTCV
ncbi:MAG: hypothetical protein HY613_02130 [Candidatus Rokubacteria bacterium]|nr:hypothetical protein [Candidatus Rokubacteria bacterium]